jgi:non-specific protein-tyrosine kinase
MKGDAERSEIYRLVTLVYPRSAAAEAYRTLRTNVDFTAVDEPVRTLLVTSAVPSEGKTVTAANLAIAFALAGRSVLLVDADLRRPSIHTIFNLPNAQGLTTLLYSDQADVDLIAHSNLHVRLRVLTSGPLSPNPAELAGSERMRRVFERMKATADIVIVDSSPLQAVTDSAILSSYLDGTLLVIDSNRTRRATIRQAREALAKANARVIGVVLNRLANRQYAEDHPYSSYYDENATAADVSPTMPTTARRAGIVKTVSRFLRLADARPRK